MQDERARFSAVKWNLNQQRLFPKSTYHRVRKRQPRVACLLQWATYSCKRDIIAVAKGPRYGRSLQLSVQLLRPYRSPSYSRHRLGPVRLVWSTLTRRLIGSGFTLTVMLVTKKEVMAVECPLCAAKPGKKCERLSGEPCFESHQNRRWVAVDKKNVHLNP